MRLCVFIYTHTKRVLYTKNTGTSRESTCQLAVLLCIWVSLTPGGLAKYSNICKRIKIFVELLE